MHVCHCYWPGPQMFPYCCTVAAMYLAAAASALRSSRVVRGTMSSKGFHSTSDPVMVGALMGLSFSPTCRTSWLLSSVEPSGLLHSITAEQGHQGGGDVPVYGSVCPILYQSGTDLPAVMQELIEL